MSKSYSKNADDIKNEDNLKNEDDIKDEDDLKNEDNLENWLSPPKKFSAPLPVKKLPGLFLDDFSP